MTNSLQTLLLLVLFSTNAIASKTNTIFKDDTINTKDKSYFKDTSKYFFPNKLLLDTVNVFGQVKNEEFYQRRKKSALFRNNWYSKQLSALDEPKLFIDYKHDAYRFTWLRTFHNPISIRVEKISNSIFIIVKQSNGAGGYNPGKLIVNDTINLSSNQWENLKNKVENLNFWNIPSVKKNDLITTDGSEWIFEAKIGDNYHMAFVQNGYDKVIRELCLYLLKLSNIKIKEREFY